MLFYPSSPNIGSVLSLFNRPDHGNDHLSGCSVAASEGKLAIVGVLELAVLIIFLNK